MQTTTSPNAVITSDRVADKEGYVVPLEKEQLSEAPRYSSDTRPAYDDLYARGISDYYGGNLT